MSFGDDFRAARKRANRTLRDTATAMGVSLTYVSTVERGTSYPFKPAVIVTAAKFFGIDPAELLASAQQTRGSFLLTARGVTALHLEVGAKLARAWPGLTKEQLDAIMAVLSE